MPTRSTGWGLKLYSMIASQLRCLYFTMRGDFAKAAVHRERVELHAAHLGSVWQVETWEAAALLLVYPQIGDVVGAARLAHRLELLGKRIPSLKRYAALARDGILSTRGELATRPAIARAIAGSTRDTRAAQLHRMGRRDGLRRAQPQLRGRARGEPRRRGK